MQILNIFHVLVAIAMIAFILIQKGAGATAGAAFGSGASGTVFGSRGAGNFLSRSTWVLATLFCLISLTMAVMASRASLAPETDLGVIANTSAPAIEEVIEQSAQDMPILIDNSESSDVPSIEALTTDSATDEAAGDMPVIEEPVASDGEG
ncbi:MAG: preprotein translocase subunit SecG [Xanthomonadales bacterium]|nr:preprotein translocase subunit SecG [Xanthomonadales bacterium]